MGSERRGYALELTLGDLRWVWCGRVPLEDNNNNNNKHKNFLETRVPGRGAKSPRLAGPAGRTRKNLWF